MTRRRLPEPPARLGPVGRAEWRHALRDMDEAGFLELPTDLLAVELHARVAEQLVAVTELARAIGPEGLVIERDERGESGITTAGALVDQLRALLGETSEHLGLTPLARLDIQQALREHPLDPEGVAARQAFARLVLQRVQQIEATERPAP